VAFKKTYGPSDPQAISRIRSEQSAQRIPPLARKPALKILIERLRLTLRPPDHNPFRIVSNFPERL
jgi:hypothetical protein